MKKTAKLWFGISIVFVLLIALRVSSGNKTEQANLLTQESELVARVSVVALEQKDIEDKILVTGTVKGSKEIELKFPQEGRVEKFFFQEGDMIPKGSIIVQMEHVKEQLILEQKEMELQKYTKLYELGAISAERLREIRLEVDLANVALEKTQIKAPLNGVMGTRYVQEDQFVTPAERIASFVAYEDVYVETGIIERYIGKVQMGQLVRVRFDRYPGQDVSGTVKSISPRLEGKSRVLMTRIELDKNNLEILPGMFATAEIVIYKQDKAAVVPSESLQKDEYGLFVWTVGEQNKVHKMYVETTYVQDEWVSLKDQQFPEQIKVIRKPPLNLKSDQIVQVD